MAPSNQPEEEKAGIRLFGALIAPPHLPPACKMENRTFEKIPNRCYRAPRRAAAMPTELIEPNDPIASPPPKVCGGGPFPCPRCHSLDTKFCYYNNYNINQPRRFCRSCHRYWTKGGNLRCVPVGSGRRRKSKGKRPSPLVPIADDGVAFLKDHSYDPAKPHAPDSSRSLFVGKVPSIAKEEEKEERFNPMKTSTIAEITPNLATAVAIDGYYGSVLFGIVPPWPSCVPDIGFPLATVGALDHTSTTKDPLWNPYGGAVPWAMMPWNVAPTNTTTTPPTLKRPLPNSYNGAEASMCIPKTLQIHDPATAIESSILHILGLHMRSDRGVFFNGLKPKGEVFRPEPIEKMAKISQNPSGRVNPVAFSMSATFRELQ